METTKQFAKRLFEENINNHIIGDLKILDTIQMPKYKNTCAVPTAMLILSSLDFIGYILRPDGKKNDSKKNIETAIRYNAYFPTTYNEQIIKELVEIYRHGMMHQFYPLQTSIKVYGIHKSLKTDLFEKLDDGIQITRSLNVNVLSKDFQEFVKKLYDEVESSTDKQLFDNICKGFKVIYPSTIHQAYKVTTETTQSIGVSANK